VENGSRLTEAVLVVGMIETKTIRLVGIGRVAKGVRQKNALSPASSLVPNNLPVPCQLVVTASLVATTQGSVQHQNPNLGPIGGGVVPTRRPHSPQLVMNPRCFLVLQAR
jgi:hypothetical protein